MFAKVLIANRGEIALRVARACRDLGIPSVAVYSTADRDAEVRRVADESVCIGPAPAARSYRNIAAVVQAALHVGADAIHPGYGFLSEDADMVNVCEENGLTFVGPSARVMDVLSDKASARALASEAGLPLLPGCLEAVPDVSEARTIASEVGLPVVLKAVAGGGGRGMAVVREREQLARAYAETKAAAKRVFGDERVYMERYLDNGRHVEVQFLCDSHGNGIHLGTRDCSVQRRHQKLIEEAPAPALSKDVLDDMAQRTVEAALSIGYCGVGTAEFLVDEDERFYFMEINSRLQVEHPVTEMVTGIDLVEQQLRVAAGQSLKLRQSDIRTDGVSVECRINAEDPERGFVPTAGVLREARLPGGPFTRVDTHSAPGMRINPEYDSLLAKIVVWAPTRDAALDRMERALHEVDMTGDGVRTTAEFLSGVIGDVEFRKARHTTGLVGRLLASDHTSS